MLDVRGLLDLPRAASDVMRDPGQHQKTVSTLNEVQIFVPPIEAHAGKLPLNEQC